jgi:glucose-1-phosphate cytidylyltransferase
MSGAEVTHFEEKPQGDGGYINGGFFVLSPKCLDYIDGDSSIWERDPMSRLARDAQLQAFTHDGFWQPMDTLREKNMLENMWQEGKAPWKTWE